ncbi:hypothetical protein V8D89_002611 [Ganoderma adspersum]
MHIDSQVPIHVPNAKQVVNLPSGTVVTNQKSGSKYKLTVGLGGTPRFILLFRNHQDGTSPLYLKASYNFPLGSRAVFPQANKALGPHYVKRGDGWALRGSRHQIQPSSDGQGSPPPQKDVNGSRVLPQSVLASQENWTEAFHLFHSVLDGMNGPRGEVYPRLGSGAGVFLQGKWTPECVQVLCPPSHQLVCAPSERDRDREEYVAFSEARVLSEEKRLTQQFGNYRQMPARKLQPPCGLVNCFRKYTDFAHPEHHGHSETDPSGTETGLQLDTGGYLVRRSLAPNTSGCCYSVDAL